MLVRSSCQAGQLMYRFTARAMPVRQTHVMCQASPDGVLAQAVCPAAAMPAPHYVSSPAAARHCEHTGERTSAAPAAQAGLQAPAPGCSAPLGRPRCQVADPVHHCCWRGAAACPRWCSAAGTAAWSSLKGQAVHHCHCHQPAGHAAGQAAGCGRELPPWQRRCGPQLHLTRQHMEQPAAVGHPVAAVREAADMQLRLLLQPCKLVILTCNAAQGCMAAVLSLQQPAMQCSSQ